MKNFLLFFSIMTIFFVSGCGQQVSKEATQPVASQEANLETVSINVTGFN